MDNKNINDFLKGIVLDKFLVNFVPGLILFYLVTSTIGVGIGDGLISLIIITSVSWTLGVLLELVIFRKAFYQRWQGAPSTSIDSLNLLFGKTGISMLIACLFWIDLEWILDIFDNRTEADMRIINAVIKFILFCAGGILLYRMYRKQVKQ